MSGPLRWRTICGSFLIAGLALAAFVFLVESASGTIRSIIDMSDEGRLIRPDPGWSPDGKAIYTSTDSVAK